MEQVEEIFLKFLGFSTAAAVLSSCESPIQKSVPYLNQPEEIIPGVANFYASSRIIKRILLQVFW